MPRILRQRGVFIIGRPLIPTSGHIIREINISKQDKVELLKELSLLDINESSTFPDIYGFSASEKVTAPVHVRTPQFYLVQGNRHYQAGDYTRAIAAYDNCIALSPGIGELHLLRGNAKSAAKLYREATDDYRQVIVNIEQPFLSLGHIENSAALDLMMFIAHFNCGNAMAELSDYEAALSSYSEATQIDGHMLPDKFQVLYNRGNIYLDATQPDKAVSRL